MRRSSRRAGCVGERSESVLAKHLSLRRDLRVLHDARCLVEQAVHLGTKALGRQSL